MGLPAQLATQWDPGQSVVTVATAAVSGPVRTVAVSVASATSAEIAAEVGRRLPMNRTPSLSPA
ncbi:hypothetical protein [Frankia sp. CcI49]|uniref:hypothetical protein n=1 Tax=Frankia sp. CcI49 TaxID=1745382 RepID=UPI001F520EE9|nr:hypothetical protein [Frankia sp. CcI49]